MARLRHKWRRRIPKDHKWRFTQKPRAIQWRTNIARIIVSPISKPRDYAAIGRRLLVIEGVGNK